jgi:glyoxylase-like metal-dependent hydrolase (beta-lactamase superfamily II)
VPDSLSISVFNSGYLPVNGGPGWDPTRQATWPASTATLIAGDRDAILVDALMTTTEGEQLAAWVADAGKNPSLIVITHGHGDHFFGAGPILAAFPDSRLVAMTVQVVDEARVQTQPAVLDNWTGWFGDQFDRDPAIPTALNTSELQIEGHPVNLIAAGGADGALATIVHIPDRDIICSGDAVYNNIHMWLWNSTPYSRATWLDSIDAIAALKPATIITGHKDPDAPDDDAQRLLDQSRGYIEDFDRAVARSSSAPEVIDTMMAKYSHYGNPYTLFVGAYSQFDG